VALALQGIEQDQDSFERLDELPRGLDAMVTRSLERLFPRAREFKDARPVFEILLAAQEPPMAELLGPATGMDVEYELPDLLDQVVTFLRARPGPGRTRYGFTNSWLAGWLANRERARRFHVSPSKGHERLAGAGLAEWERNPAKMSAYHLKFL